MDDTAPPTTLDNSNSHQEETPAETLTSKEVPQTIPAKGDEKASQKYLNQIIDLIDNNKVKVIHTNLDKFNISSLQDHYSMDLTEYEIEVSHSKDPNTSKDYYVMLFNNIKKIQSCPPQKIILAYIHINDQQFKEFKEVADAYIERKMKEEEEKRFKEAMIPIDEMLNNLGIGKEKTVVDEEQSVPISEESQDTEGEKEKAQETSPYLSNIPTF